MKNTYKRKWQLLISFFKKNRWKAIGAILAGMIANIFTILIPVSLGKYFDLLFGFHSHRAAFLDLLPFSFWENIQEYLIFLIGLIFLKTVFQYLQRLQTAVLGELFVKELREQLFRQQLEIQTSVYDSRGTGRYLLRHSGDLKSIQNFLTKGVIRFSTDIFLLFLAFLSLAWLNETIFSIILGGFVVIGLVVYFLNKILFRISVKRRNVRSGLLSFVNTHLKSVKTIKVFNKAITENKKYDKRSSQLFDVGVRFQKVYNLIFVLVPSLLRLILVAVLYAIYLEKGNPNIRLNAGNTLGFIFLFITILPIFRRVLRISTIWELGSISLDKLSKVFEMPVDKNTYPLQKYQFKGGKIEFRKVAFSYENSASLFEHLDFTILPKQFNQIKIGNGEGKSTLVKLFSALYFPNQGIIEFDGQDILDLEIKSIRKKMTFISDDFPLLGRTVFEAISYSRRNEKREKAQIVLDEFQRKIPPRLQLNLSDKVLEGGSNLSHSQIKMLQYVRAALSRKPIIVIDEPLRNLEQNTRKNILRWLKKQSANRTVILLCRTWNQPSIVIDHVIDIC